MCCVSPCVRAHPQSAEAGGDRRGRQAGARRRGGRAVAGRVRPLAGAGVAGGSHPEDVPAIRLQGLHLNGMPTSVASEGRADVERRVARTSAYRVTHSRE